MGQCPPPVAPKSPSQRGGHAAEDAARRDPMTHAQGVSLASVAQIEDAHRWHPHQIETFKRSTATRCVETLTDVVGGMNNRGSTRWIGPTRACRGRRGDVAP